MIGKTRARARQRQHFIIASWLLPARARTSSRTHRARSIRARASETTCIIFSLFAFPRVPLIACVHRSCSPRSRARRRVTPHRPRAAQNASAAGLQSRRARLAATTSPRRRHCSKSNFAHRVRASRPCFRARVASRSRCDYPVTAVGDWRERVSRVERDVERESRRRLSRSRSTTTSEAADEMYALSTASSSSSSRRRASHREASEARRCRVVVVVVVSSRRRGWRFPVHAGVSTMTDRP